jgi:hypothetical protein
MQGRSAIEPNRPDQGWRGVSRNPRISAEAKAMISWVVLVAAITVAVGYLAGMLYATL